MIIYDYDNHRLGSTYTGMELVHHVKSGNLHVEYQGGYFAKVLTEWGRNFCMKTDKRISLRVASREFESLVRKDLLDAEFSPEPIRGKRIKPVSESRKWQNKEYSRERKAFLAEYPRCAVYPGMKATQIHHMKGREGKLLLDKRYWLPVSHKAHRKITDDSKWAISKGYSLKRNAKEIE